MMKIKTPAKVNLFLHLFGKNYSGYHELQSFVVFVTLWDYISIKPAKKYNLAVTCNTPRQSYLLPCNENNLVTKAVKYIQQTFNIKSNVNIELEKNIPIAAGIGGASSNVAGVLNALKELWQIKVSDHKFSQMALNLGADIPMCLYSKSALVEGIGECFYDMPLKFKLFMLLVNPLKPVLTKDVYEQTSLNDCKADKLSKSEILQATQCKSTFFTLIKKLNNHLSIAAQKLEPSIINILTDLKSTNPIVANMSGSGATCFAIYNSEQELNMAYKNLRKNYDNYFIQPVCSLN